jgi:hypothetical protein
MNKNKKNKEWQRKVRKRPITFRELAEESPN